MEMSMMESGWMIEPMVKESISMSMEPGIKALGKMIYRMVKE